MKIKSENLFYYKTLPLKEITFSELFKLSFLVRKGQFLYPEGPSFV
jgi:hypothetical protein